MSFVHLHVHTEYSLLDGACRIPDLVKEAKGMGMPALAMTDHGNMYGAIEFYEECVKQGIKPIIGCEVYMAQGSRLEKKGGQANGRDPNFHFLLLVKNEVGYKNLTKLVTSAHLEGMYYKPRIDKEILAQYSEGLIGTSACLKSEIATAVMENRLADAERSIEEFKTILGEGNFYLEIHNHGILAEEQIRAQYARLAKKLNVPLVAANDVHFTKREHASAHDVLICIQTGARLFDEKRMRSAGPEFYLKSPEEMAELFAEFPEAVENTLKIAEQCNLKIELGVNKYPTFQVPADTTREAYFKKLCHEGLQRRFGKLPADSELKQRLDFEIGVIEKMGFVSYFLIVWDFIDYAKRNGIPVGPGRGSAAGSLVAYCLGITDLDPIRYGLLFERFLNPDRISPPDIDVDFCQNRRGEVIQYVRQKYGDRSVAQIITFGTLGPKMAIRDVARVMGLSFAEASRVADLVPRDPNITIDSALKSVAELNRIYEEDETVQQVIDTAKTLEGLSRQTGIHAAGVVIADGDLTEYLPLTKDDEGTIITQYSMEPLGAIGLLKMDFLGLKTLTVIQDCLDLIEHSTSTKVTTESMPLDDPATFALLNRAQNVGVFQVESPGMRRVCLEFQIETIDDIIALIALYRPGPMDLIDDYIKRKKGKVEITYAHPLLEKVSADTYGIMIYQEQVMNAARLLAGYSLGDADLLRRAMGKKKKEEMDKQRAIFVQGCAKHNDIPKHQAEEIFDLLEKFAGYGFNKSHSAAYGLVSYHTAYLKANYPVQYMAALLSNELDNTDKIALFIAEAKSMGISVLPACVNQSDLRFTVAPNQIRFGLGAIKNVGINTVQSILQARTEGGAFTSIDDFCARVDYKSINKKTLESLIKCGAFDCIDTNRALLMTQIDSALSKAGASARDKEKGQTSLFGDADDSWSTPQSTQNSGLKIAPWSMGERLAHEKELLGFYVTGHPVDEFEQELQFFRTHLISDLEEDSGLVRIAGVIGYFEVLTSKKDQRPYARTVLEDLTGKTEIMLFSEAYTKIGAHLQVGLPLVCTGKIESQSENQWRFRMFETVILGQALEKYVQRVEVTLDWTENMIARLEELGETLSKHHGSTPLHVKFYPKQQVLAELVTHKKWHVKPSPELLRDLGNIHVACNYITAPPTQKPKANFNRKFATAKN